MPKPTGAISLILPTRDIVHNHRFNERIFRLVGQDAKTLGQFTLQQWVQNQLDMRRYYTRFVSQAELLEDALLTYIVEPRVDLTEDVLRKVSNRMMQIVLEYHETINPLLRSFCDHAADEEHIRFDDWLGADMIVSIDRL